MGLLLKELFRDMRKKEKPLHRVEKRAAKHWIKRRLLRLFPELQNDPQGLEDLYQALDLEARPGCGPGGAMAFEVIIPEQYSP
jgi:hypothetical protein